jgi:hypothetical protein
MTLSAPLSTGIFSVQGWAGPADAAASHARQEALPQIPLRVSAPRSTQVLDGRPVAAGERAGAQARFAGRLQADAAAERLGHRDFGAAAALALGGMGLRALGGVFAGGAWRALRRLDLDDNLLAEVPLLNF